MSAPRVGWTDNTFALYNSLVGFGFPLLRHTGVYWGQCLTRALNQHLAESPELEAILTVDYDTTFTRDDVKELLAKEGFDRNLGARPLRRAIQRLVEDPLSDALLHGEFSEGVSIEAVLQDGVITFRRAEEFASLTG